MKTIIIRPNEKKVRIEEDLGAEPAIKTKVLNG